MDEEIIRRTQVNGRTTLLRTESANPCLFWGGKIRACAWLMILAHLGAKPPVTDWRQLAKRGGDAAVEYLFGEWRTGKASPGTRRLRPQREQQRGESGWYDQYRWGLLLACLAEDHETVDRLLRWPGWDLAVDQGSLEHPREDNRFHIAIAALLRGDEAETTKVELDRIRSGRQTHAKSMLRVVDAITAKDGASVAESFARLLAHHRKRRASMPPILGAVDVDASILFHIGSRSGLDIKAALPQQPDLSDLILTQSSIERGVRTAAEEAPGDSAGQAAPNPISG